MKLTILKKTGMIALMAAICFMQAQAQNKDIDKGNDILKKAMEQSDAFKRGQLLTTAREHYTKGGLKSPEVNVLIGDAYLEKNDLQNAYNSYSAASKEDKKIGLKKVAEAYVEQAFGGEDEKAKEKDLRKAMSIFGRADASKEGARLIGDRFYEEGFDSYDRALDYYIAGESAVKVEQIANAYLAKGGDYASKAAEAYLKLKTPEGYHKGGDIYYDRKEYQKAIDAYIAGSDVAGIRKYANLLYSEHRDEEADNLIVRLAENLAEKKSDDELEKLAKEVEGKGSYGLSAKIYEKAGNVTLADKARAYDALTNFRLEEAKSIFAGQGDDAGVQMIDNNSKVLTALADIYDELEQVMKGAPFVSMITDSVTGTSAPSAADQKMVEDYYATKGVRDQVINNVYNIASSFAKLGDPNLKKYVRLAFLKFGAVRNILDKDTLAVRKQKTEIKTRDIVL